MTQQQIAAVPAGPFPAQREPSVFARTPAAVVRWGWRARWQLTPLVAGGGVFVLGYSAPVPTSCALMLTAATSWSLRGVGPGDGRKWLSRRERETVAVWAAAAGAWSTASSLALLEPRWSLAALAVATAWPSLRWARSRKVRKDDLAKEARALLAGWEPIVGAWGPERLRGSRVVPRTVSTPGKGAVAFTVKLAHGVHGASATSEDTRRGAEAALGLPVGTLNLTAVREDSTLLRVAISPKRHLEERGGTPWTPECVKPDGRVDLAETPDGGPAFIRLHDEDGVMHGWISGPTGSGKTETLVAWIVALLLRGFTVIYMDGGEGTSLPAWLVPHLELITTTPDGHRAAIDMFDKIMRGRASRRGVGATRWRVGQEDDPEIALIADEATLIDRGLSPSHRQKCADFGRICRKLGGSFVQTTQDPLASSLIGGSDARANLTQVVAHKPMRSVNGRIAMDGVDVDLMLLPDGPGWAGVNSRGGGLSPQARVRMVEPSRAEQALTARVDRSISVADFVAVGGPTPAEPEESEESLPAREKSRNRLVELIAAHGRITIGFLAPDDGTRPHVECDTADCPGWALGRRQTLKHLNALLADGVLGKEKYEWFVV